MPGLKLPSSASGGAVFPNHKKLMKRFATGGEKAKLSSHVALRSLGNEQNETADSRIPIEWTNTAAEDKYRD